MTSYAKVLGDLFVSFCMFASSTRSSTSRPDRGCGGQYVVPLIISIPSLIRLRQCLIEFWRIRGAHGKVGGSGSSGWGGQHLANALKYASAFPVIVLSALQRGYDPAKMGMSEAGLFRLWYAIESSFDVLVTNSNFAGSSSSFLTPSIHSIGMSLRTGTSASSPAQKHEMIRNTSGAYGGIPSSILRKSTTAPLLSIFCYDVLGASSCRPIWIISTISKVASF